MAREHGKIATYNHGCHAGADGGACDECKRAAREARQRRRNASAPAEVVAKDVGAGTCPHCGRPVSTGHGLARHIAACKEVTR